VDTVTNHDEISVKQKHNNEVSGIHKS